MRAIYVSYDGVLDPLGASQIVPYVVGLAGRGVAFTVVSFEKPSQWRRRPRVEAMRDRLRTASVAWRPLAYHGRPRVAATLYDVMTGARAIALEISRAVPDVIHCRGEIAMVMARLAGIPSRSRLVHDVRGFFADERVETGSWRSGGPIDRMVRLMEARNLQRADGAVVLTRAAGVELLRRRPGLPVFRVIPTCVDTSLFTPRPPGECPTYGVVYSGSLGTWYITEKIVTFARAAREFVPGPALFLTPDVDECRLLGIDEDWAQVRTVDYGDVAAWLRRGVALSFFTRRGASKSASCPTKVAEALACGLPVVCSRGIGDLDEIIEDEAVGILVEDVSDSDFRAAARRLRALLSDPGLAERCRGLADSRFSLERGVDSYEQLYRDVTSSARAGVGVP